MATKIQQRPAHSDSRPMTSAPKRDDSTQPKRIPQDPIPVPQQQVRPAAATKYPAGYFFG
jgi:hypothetical protein